MTKHAKRSLAQAKAAARKAERAAKHAAMLAAHAERRTRILQWEAAYDLWVAADCKGPRPIHPYDLTLSSATQDDAAELLAAAAELSIDLAA
jgi:hypothetical protein